MKIERLLSPRAVAELEGISQTTVYKRLSAGEYDGVKDGFMTRITAASVARRRETLPKATYGKNKGIFGVPPKPAAS
jgi:hypothetical protein